MKKICFDIGGSSIKLNIFDENNISILNDKIIHKQFIMTEIITGFKMRTVKLQDCLEQIREYIEQFNQAVEVGIAIPGVIDNINNKVLSQSSISDIDIDINNFFSKITLVKKLKIENDAKAAAIGELIYGQNNQITNAIILTIGSGLGGGIIINKKVYKGSHNGAGEFSQIISNMNSQEVNLNELIVGSTSTGSICEMYSYLSKLDHKINGQEFMQLVLDKNKLALELFNKQIKTLRNLLINFQVIFDVEKILIGGGISDNNYFIDKLKEEVDSINYWKINVEKCKLSNNAACYGMLAILVDEYQYD
ncbi:ROK family protein [Spiroplasma culicicola]|uniref:Transcriptional regulator n=1 Tax=Spiroplasma culicicola AES-1 TaxID=1276246 RepID=W6AGZ4_9MOLU|nr:ROK family protein [Spiroplasma culicicola]AHI52959.1 transcriptional regulator [Spiroplasma culicicola AES-1]